MISIFFSTWSPPDSGALIGRRCPGGDTNFLIRQKTLFGSSVDFFWESREQPQRFLSFLTRHTAQRCFSPHPGKFLSMPQIHSETSSTSYWFISYRYYNLIVLQKTPVRVGRGGLRNLLWHPSVGDFGRSVTSNPPKIDHYECVVNFCSCCG